MSETFRKADLALIEDREDIIDLLSRFSEESSFPRHMPEETKKTLVDNLIEFPTTQIYFADVDGTSTGIAVCFLGFSTFLNAPVMNLHDLYIKKEYQGQGIGKKFLTFVEQQGKELGCCRITCEVYKTNDRANKLYESLNYNGGPKDEPGKIMYALYKEL